MIFTLNAETLPITPVNVTVAIDSDNDIEVRYDGVIVGWFFDTNGKFVTCSVDDSADRARLTAKGVEFGDDYCIFVG